MVFPFEQFFFVFSFSQNNCQLCFFSNTNLESLPFNTRSCLYPHFTVALRFEALSTEVTIHYNSLNFPHTIILRSFQSVHLDLSRSPFVVKDVAWIVHSMFLCLTSGKISEIFGNPSVNISEIFPSKLFLLFRENLNATPPLKKVHRQIRTTWSKAGSLFLFVEYKPLFLSKNMTF